MKQYVENTILEWEISVFWVCLRMKACAHEYMHGLESAFRVMYKNSQAKSPWTPLFCSPLRKSCGASLVAQRLRLHPPMQWTRVRALVQGDPTCRRATQPARHNYWACALEPASHNYWALVPQLLKPACLEPMLHNERSHCNQKSAYRNKE